MWTPVRVGAFILATLVILAIGVFLIGEKQFLFSSTYQLKAQFKSEAGLNGGAEVRVGGIHKGTVRLIQLPTRSDGDVTVVMELHRSTRAVIKKDSVVSIETEGLVGDKYVEVSFGSPNAATADNGDTLQGVPPLEIGDVVKKTNEVLVAAKGSFGQMQAIGEKINSGQGTMGALVNDKKMYREMSGNRGEFPGRPAGPESIDERQSILSYDRAISFVIALRSYSGAALSTYS